MKKLVKIHEARDQYQSTPGELEARSGSQIPEQGGYTCLCATGFIEIDADHCIDINECDIGSMCDDIEICVNTRGSYSCLCIDGYEKPRVDSGDGEGITVGEGCVDIDECASEQSYDCTENENCFNIEGSYECHAKPGFYKLNDQETIDINESRLQ